MTEDVSSQESVLEWPAVLEMKSAKRLAAPSQALWHRELLREFDGNITDAEICKALQWVFSLDSGYRLRKEPHEITQADVRMWVCMWRKAGAGQSASDVAGMSSDYIRMERMSRIRANRTDAMAVWEIICEPDDVNECEWLERAANDIGIDTRSPRKEVAGMFRTWLQSVTREWMNAKPKGARA